MVQQGLTSLIFLTLIFSASGNIISDLIKNVLTNGIHAERIDLGEDIGNISDLHLTLHDRNFTVKDAGFFGLDLTLHDSKINLATKYDIKQLYIPGLFTAEGKGRIEISLIEPVIKMYLKAQPLFDELSVDFRDLSLSVKESPVFIENLFYDPEVSQYLSTLVGNVLPDILTRITASHKDILKPLTEYLLKGVYHCLMNESDNLEKCFEKLINGSLKTLQENEFFLEKQVFDQKGNFNFKKLAEKLKL